MEEKAADATAAPCALAGIAGIAGRGLDAGGGGVGADGGKLHQTYVLSLGERVELPWQSQDSPASSLRSVGAVFTMTLSPSALLNGTSSVELGEMAHGFAVDLVEAAVNERHVWFHSSLNSSMAITPYSQVYGMHPKLFNFGEDGRMELTLTGQMLQAAGLSGSLPRRSCSATPCARGRRCPPASSSSASATAERSPRQGDDASATSPQDGGRLVTLGVPAGTNVTELLRHPQKALELFKLVDTPGNAAIEEHKNSVKEKVAEAKALGEEMASLREQISETRVRLGALRAANGPNEGDAVGARTLTPEELTIISELDALRSSFQDKTWELWEAKKEAERIHKLLEEEAVRKQKRFEAWFMALRRAMRARSRGRVGNASTGAVKFASEPPPGDAEA